MNFDDCERYREIDFRYRMENFWATFRDHKRFVLFGGLLASIKTSRIWKDWGFVSFSDYCRGGLKIVPAYHENLYISTYTRMKALQVEVPQLCEIERLYSMRKVLSVSKYARTQSEFFKMLNDEAYTKERMKAEKNSPPRGRSRTAINCDLPRGKFETFDTALAAIRKQEKLPEKDAYALMAILSFATLRKNTPDHSIIHLCRRSGIDEKRVLQILNRI